MESNLKKWTNLLGGWKDRYFILTDDVLTYYVCKVIFISFLNYQAGKKLG